MKTKNLILGTLAIVFALGSAFASFANEDLTQTVYIKAKQLASQQNFTCEAVNLPDGTCNAIGTNNCSVIIQLSPSGSAATTAHSDAACTMPLKDNSANVDTYDIVPSWDPQVVF